MCVIPNDLPIISDLTICSEMISSKIRLLILDFVFGPVRLALSRFEFFSAPSIDFEIFFLNSILSIFRAGAKRFKPESVCHRDRG